MCLQCNKETKGKFCNNNCRKKYSYHNDKEYRLNHIQRVRDNVEEKRELDKFNKQRIINAKLIEEASKLTIDPKVLELYNLLYNKR